MSTGRLANALAPSRTGHAGAFPGTTSGTPLVARPASPSDVSAKHWTLRAPQGAVVDETTSAKSRTLLRAHARPPAWRTGVHVDVDQAALARNPLGGADLRSRCRHVKERGANTRTRPTSFPAKTRDPDESASERTSRYRRVHPSPSPSVECFCSIDERPHRGHAQWIIGETQLTERARGLHISGHARPRHSALDDETWLACLRCARQRRARPSSTLWQPRVLVTSRLEACVRRRSSPSRSPVSM